MCMDDVWGTLCGIIWLEIDSHVVCRQLGYNDYGMLFVSLHVMYMYIHVCYCTCMYTCTSTYVTVLVY